MSKGFFSTFLRIASFAVNFIPGIGQLVSAALVIGLNVGAALIAPKGRQQARQASATSLQLGEVPRQAVFGRAAVAGSLCNAFNYGGKYGTDWEVLVLALADHECDALEGFYVNDTYVAFAGDGAVAGYNGQLEVHWRPGTEGQSIPAVMTTYGGYAPSDNGAGVCYVAVAYKADASDAKNPIWPSGRPRFLFVLRGAKCYDAREDSTVTGGSGAELWANPATRAWSENPIVCRYTWVRGLYACNRVGDADMLLVGRGLSAVEAPPENVASRANVCDEEVALTAGGSEQRYRCGGLLKADEEFGTVEEFFAAACGGVITQPQGCVEIEPGQAKAPSFAFTDADLIVGSEVRWNDFRSEADDEWVNTVIPRYVEPSQRWADHAAPIRRNIADVIEDGGPREETLALSLVTSGTQAGRCGEIRRRMGRLQGNGSVTLGPRFGEIEEGDWGVWFSERRFGGEGRTVRVEAWSSPENGHMQLQLRQISATCYSDGADFDDGSVAEPQEPPPDIGAPEVGSWAFTAAPIGGVLPGLVFEGEVEDRSARFVRLEYRKDDGVTAPAVATDWISAGVFGPDVTRHQVTGAEAGADYYGAVSYVVDDIPGDRLILGPVTAPNFDLVDNYSELTANFNDRNDRIATIPVAPALPGGGAAVNHTNNKDGSVDLSFNWSFAGDEADNDGFEVLLYASTGTGAYTIGTDPTNERVLSVPIDKRAFIERGVPADRRYTWAVRTYRVVDPDIDIDQVLHSAWVKSTVSGENPYHPPTQVAGAGDITTTINGKPAADVSSAVTNFNSRNDRIATTPVTPTMLTGGNAVDHSNNDDASVDIAFKWDFVGSENDNDGFEIEVYSSTSAAAYAPGSSPDGLVTRVPIQRRAFVLQGVTANRYYTIAIRTYRGVDQDISSTGVLYSAWVKSTVSGENPYRPSSSVAWPGNVTGSIGGRSATVVAASINPDGSIASGKVVEDSIANGAINLAGYSLSTTGWLYTTSGTRNHYFTAASVVATATGQSLLARAVIPYRLRKINPALGETYTGNFRLVLLEDDGGGSGFLVDLVSYDFPVSEMWDAPTVTDGSTKWFGQRWMTLEHRFTGPVNLIAGRSYAIGVEVDVPGTNHLYIEKIYSRLDLMKKTQ